MRRLLDNPRLMRTIVGWMIPLSCAEWALATWTGLVHSVPYISHLSQLAITVSLIPWYQGLRVEARQDEEDVAEDVKQKLIDDTDIKESER